MTGFRFLCSLFFHEAFRALSRNKLRNSLAALGITIGTAAVVCVVAIGKAGSDHAEDQLHNLGDNLVWVEAGGRAINGVRTGNHGTNSLTMDDMDAILREVREIKSVSPNVDGSVRVGVGNKNWATQYRGVGVDFTDIKNWPLALGSPLTADAVTHAANVCLLGETVRQQLFGEEDPVGKEIRLGALVCDVIGVLSPKGQSGFGRDQDDTILLPYTTVQMKIRGKGNAWVDDIMCSARSYEDVDAAVANISALIRDRHHIRAGEPDDFNIRRPDEVIKAEIASKHTMAVFLISIAAVSLVVGGVGIMNVMLASVVERTREIGVRLAVGAKDWAVQAQFMGEAVILSLGGGLAGAVLGSISSVILARALDWPISIPVQALILAPGFSIVVGVFFGFYPARQAAKLDPIAALRWE